MTFKKGHTTWNKGTVGVMRANNGTFKKGHIALNRLPVGTISSRKDSSGILRNYVKIKEPSVWSQYPHYLWKKAGRKLKKGYCLHHINNNSSDDRIENLVLVSRQDHTKLHNRWNTKNIKQGKHKNNSKNVNKWI